MLSLANVPTVALTVGAARNVFYIHRDLLCEASPVFNAAFKGTGSFQESQTQSMDLEEDDVEVFAVITQWMYTKVCNLPDPCADEENGGSEPYFMRVATVYAAAEKYGIVMLKNALVDSIFSAAQSHPRPRHPTLKVTTYIYNTTPLGSPLRKLMVAWQTWHAFRSWYEFENTPARLAEIPEFAADLACSMGMRHYGYVKSSPFTGKSDVYHEQMSKPKEQRTLSAERMNDTSIASSTEQRDGGTETNRD